MYLPRSALLLAILALPALALPPAPAWAGDGDEPVAKKPVAKKTPQSVLWTYDKEGDTRVLDVTHMSSEIRKALHVQMQANDWVRRARPQQGTVPQPPAPRSPQPPKEPAKQPAKQPAKKPAAELDIAELIKRGGKLPEDWRPHGMGPGPFRSDEPFTGPPPPAAGRGTRAALAAPKALAALLLAYLDVKHDPLKGPIYEGVLRDLAAGVLTSERAAGGMQPGMRRVLKGLSDPKAAPVYQEILRLLVDTLPRASDRQPEPSRWTRVERGPGPAAPPLPRPPARPSAPAPDAHGPAKLGGASLMYVYANVLYARANGSPLTYVEIVIVPVGSTADRAGLQPSDRIIRIDGKPVDEAGVRRAAKVFTDGGQLTLGLVRKDDKRETLTLLLEKE